MAKFTQRQRIALHICPCESDPLPPAPGFPETRHQCEREQGHGGWHQCYCRTFFAPDGRTMRQQELFPWGPPGA